MSFRLGAVLGAIGLLAFGAACGSSSNPGDPGGGVGPPEFLANACPDVTMSGVAGPQAVTFATPAATGGTPPVATTCSPASGTQFPVGTTAVSCTARDAINRSAVCSFNVILKAQHLGAMHVIAFGDSITAGENGDEPPPPGFSSSFTPAPCVGTATTLANTRVVQGVVRPQYFDPSISYPSQLLVLLNTRFAGETFTIENEGQPNEQVPAGQIRLANCFSTGDRPDVLLLLEGINDVAAGSNGFAPSPSQEQAIVNVLKQDASMAVSAGVSYIFVSTILPVRTCPLGSDQACRVGKIGDPDTSTTANNSIDQVNALIRAGIGGATIVDANAMFKAGDVNSLIGLDGLHPTAAGYAVLAQAWMTAITGKIPITSLRRLP